ncbi:MAG: FtsW/RodA/SpoVE family cell cycle protein [Candidatus Krumholzibacteriia bacterium]
MRLPRPGLHLRNDDLDLGFVGAVLTLVLLGTIAVFGAGSFQPGVSDMHHFLMRHLERLAVGLVAAVGFALLDHVRLRRAWLVYGALGACLALTAIPVILRTAGIDRWVELPGVGQFQPVELAKLALIVFLAYRLSRSTLDRPLAGRSLAVTLLAGPVALMVLLALQPNFGNVLVTALVTALMLVLAGLDLRWLAAAVPAGGLAAVAGYLASSKLHLRIQQWWSGWQGRGVDGEPPFSYQVHQSLLGMGAGGWHGLGAGGSHNKFSFLPENHTDFAFSYLGETLGLAGTLVVLAALVVLIWRTLIIARRATTPFGRLLAAGLGGMLFIYGAANIAMVTGVTPVMGIPLPFVSYGGSALVTNLAAVGLILNVDRQSRGRRRRRA